MNILVNVFQGWIFFRMYAIFFKSRGLDHTKYGISSKNFSTIIIPPNIFYQNFPTKIFHWTFSTNTFSPNKFPPNCSTKLFPPKQIFHLSAHSLNIWVSHNLLGLVYYSYYLCCYDEGQLQCIAMLFMWTRGSNITSLENNFLGFFLSKWWSSYNSRAGSQSCTVDYLFSSGLNNNKNNTGKSIFLH